MTGFPAIVGILGWTGYLLFWAVVAGVVCILIKWINDKL